MPPNPLSYPSLKCVLENLEAIKRFHITARTPSLQKIDKLVPIRMENLCMSRNELTINELSIAFMSNMAYNMKTRKSISYSVRSENPMKKAIDYYLVGRSKILLNQLDSIKTTKIRMADDAANLKLRVNCLNIRDQENFEPDFLLIHPDSFPLKAIKTTLIRTATSDHPIIKSARSLILSIRHEYPPTQLEDIKKLENKTIVFDQGQFSFGKFSIFEFIRCLIESVPIGKTFILLQSDGYITSHLSHVKMGYNRYSNPLDSVQERFIPGAPRFLIPINDTSSIQVYGIEEIKNGRKTEKVVFKVMPADC
ncbi:hypothetical protein GCK72_007958 [Caenorhabditis remanei]|uniref:DUF38 domain-containing protein n=1 Tax=Caenorhabditis remanei TaxID=31234 RepID=A0A6A5HNV8_CAERE|nr:hypothetical protein GCK72_007958 [Caenorhabditis remanei]KAF1767997.1 hypothetical protein GCK72_007958 [Caenorhabditis remanei]